MNSDAPLFTGLTVIPYDLSSEWLGFKGVCETFKKNETGVAWSTKRLAGTIEGARKMSICTRTVFASLVTMCVATVGFTAAGETPLLVGCVAIPVDEYKQPMKDFVAAHPSIPVTETCSTETVPDVFYGVVAARGESDGSLSGVIDYAVPESGPNLILKHREFRERATDLTPWESLTQGMDALNALLDEMPPNVRDAVTAGGHVWAIPYYADAQTFVVRADMFKAAGVAVPRDWDWSTFEVDSRKVQGIVDTGQFKKMGLPVPPKAAYLPPTTYTDFWASFVASSLGASDGVLRFSSPDGISFVETMKRWGDSGSIGFIPDKFPKELGQLLIDTGNTAIALVDARTVLATSAMLRGASSENAVYAPSELVRVPIPHRPEGEVVPSPVTMRAWAIPRQTSLNVAQTAAKYVSWITDHSSTFYRQTGTLPPTSSLAREAFGPSIQELYDALMAPQTTSRMPDSYWKRFSTEFSRHLGGAISPQSFANAMDTVSNTEK